MPDTRDPSALVRHAIQAGDWKLVELLARTLGGCRTLPHRGAQHAYARLCLKLGLTEPRDYHRP